MKALTVHARIADYEDAAAFIESWLQHIRLSKQIISENGIVFETLFNDSAISTHADKSGSTHADVYL